MKVWVTRDNGNGHTAVFGGEEKPTHLVAGDDLTGIQEGLAMVNGGDVWDDGYAKCYEMLRITRETFKHCFGFTPRKGSCKQYELSLTEIEE
jgi:hypothetical protein